MSAPQNQNCPNRSIITLIRPELARDLRRGANCPVAILLLLHLRLAYGCGEPSPIIPERVAQSLPLSEAVIRRAREWLLGHHLIVRSATAPTTTGRPGRPPALYEWK